MQVASFRQRVDGLPTARSRATGYFKFCQAARIARRAFVSSLTAQPVAVRSSWSCERVLTRHGLGLNRGQRGFSIPNKRRTWRVHAGDSLTPLGYDLLTFLGTTVAVVPLFKKLKISPVLGFFVWRCSPTAVRLPSRAIGDTKAVGAGSPFPSV